MFEKMLDPALNLITKVVPDLDKRAEIEKEIITLKTGLEREILKERTRVLELESTSKSFLTRNWRPLMQLSFGFLFISILCYYFLMRPVMEDLGMHILAKEFPKHLAYAIEIYLGGLGFPVIGNVFKKR